MALPENQTTPLLIDGVEVHIEGAGPETLVMIHGWPDTWRVWDAQVAHFKTSHRCVRFTLPGFDVQGPRRAWSIDELVAFFDKVIDQLSPNDPVTLMLHDWGCVFGYEYLMRHPQRVKRLVAIDIGDARSSEFWASCPPRAKAGIVAYQGWLALAWLVGGLSRRAGDAMTRWMARSLGCRSEPALIGACMNYPYFIVWSGWHGSYRGLRPVAPSCPTFFAWGERKPFMFHSPGWLNTIAARPGNHVESYATGHWVMVRAAPSFNAAVSRWMSA
jgi:pimeloyl-ACP methyl ester carboxylesterase